MAFRDLLYDPTFWGMLLIQFLFYLYMRGQGVQSYFTDDEKESLFEKLPQEGSKNVNDFGSQNGNRVRISRTNVEKLGRLDLIVIGSGLGGLTVAAVMAKCGYKVVVLEQHEQAGGALATTEEKGVEFDNGCHYVGGGVGGVSSPLRKILEIVTGGFVKFGKMDECYDVAAVVDKEGGKAAEAFHFYADTERTKAELKKRFTDPKDQRCIDRYFFYAWLTNLCLFPWAFCKLFPTTYWREFFGKLCLAPIIIVAGGTTETKLGQWTTNKKLIGVLSYMHGGHGLTPSRASFVAQAVATHHMKGGAWYPIGGPVSIVMAACEVIRKNGGLVLTNSEVTRLLFDDEHDVGKHAIKIRSGKCWGVVVNGHEMYAPRVISDVGIRNTFLKLVPERHRHRLGPIVKRLKHFDGIAIGTESYVLEKSKDGSFDVSDAKEAKEDGYNVVQLKKFGVGPSTCTVELHAGFHEGMEELGLGAENRWVFPSWDHDENHKRFKKKFTNDISSCFITCCKKDESWDKRWPGRSAVKVVCAVEYEWFADYQNLKAEDRPFEYQKFKDMWGERLVKVLEGQYPQLKGKVKTWSVHSPLDRNDRFGVARGEVGGVEHTVERYLKYHAEFSPRTDIDGLWLTGKDVSCGVGVAASVWGGMLCVFSISKQRMMEFALACF